MQISGSTTSSHAKIANIRRRKWHYTDELFRSWTCRSRDQKEDQQQGMSMEEFPSSPDLDLAAICFFPPLLCRSRWSGSGRGGSALTRTVCPAFLPSLLFYLLLRWVFPRPPFAGGPLIFSSILAGESAKAECATRVSVLPSLWWPRVDVLPNFCKRLPALSFTSHKKVLASMVAEHVIWFEFELPSLVEFNEFLAGNVHGTYGEEKWCLCASILQKWR